MSTWKYSTCTGVCLGPAGFVSALSVPCPDSPRRIPTVLGCQNPESSPRETQANQVVTATILARAWAELSASSCVADVSRQRHGQYTAIATGYCRYLPLPKVVGTIVVIVSTDQLHGRNYTRSCVLPVNAPSLQLSPFISLPPSLQACGTRQAYPACLDGYLVKLHLRTSRTFDAFTTTGHQLRCSADIQTALTRRNFHVAPSPYFAALIYTPSGHFSDTLTSRPPLNHARHTHGQSLKVAQRGYAGRAGFSLARCASGVLRLQRSLGELCSAAVVRNCYNHAAQQPVRGVAVYWCFLDPLSVVSGIFPQTWWNPTMLHPWNHKDREHERRFTSPPYVRFDE